MNRLELVENQVKQLSGEELPAFREWFATYSATDPEFAEKMAKVDDVASRYSNALRDLSVKTSFRQA